jgi:replicative DNA helicase
MALLGAMIFEPSTIGLAVEIVGSEEAFLATANRIVYGAILRLHMAGRPVDLVTVRDELAKDRLLESVGGADYLVSLVEGVPNAANAEEYARTVKDKAVLRHIIQACQQVIRTATDVTENVGVVRDEAEKIVFSALAKDSSSVATPLSSIIKDTFQQIDSLRSREGRLLGLPTGFYEIDDLLSGLQPGQLYVVAGRPSMGKTSFALNIIENVAIKEGKPCLFFSLEMAASQISQSFLCSRARVDSSLLRAGRVTNEEYERLQMAAVAFNDAKIYIDDAADLSALELRTRSRRMKAAHGIELVVVDYLQKMHARTSVKQQDSRQIEIAMISSNLKSLAKELNVPVVALAQLNRSAEGREDRKPLLSDLRESGAIEQDADAVMALYRDEYYHPDTEKKGVAEILLLKNRTGPVGNVDMAFIKQYTRFENLSRYQ